MKEYHLHSLVPMQTSTRQDNIAMNLQWMSTVCIPLSQCRQVQDKRILQWTCNEGVPFAFPCPYANKYKTCEYCNELAIKVCRLHSLVPMKKVQDKRILQWTCNESVPFAFPCPIANKYKTSEYCNELAMNVYRKRIFHNMKPHGANHVFVHVSYKCIVTMYGRASCWASITNYYSSTSFRTSDFGEVV
jgi:hypothetical protein